MWADAQRDGRPSHYSIWNSILVQEMAKHCAVWLSSVERHRCSNEAKKQNPLKFAGMQQTNEPISAASGPKFTILWEHVGQILLFDLFSDCRYVP